MVSPSPIRAGARVVKNGSNIRRLTSSPTPSPGVLHHQLDAAVPRPEREHQSSAARHGVERIAHEMSPRVPQRRLVAAHGGTASRSAAISMGRCPPPSSFERVRANADGILDQGLHVRGIARGRRSGHGQ
jgi:hypothetical protein